MEHRNWKDQPDKLQWQGDYMVFTSELHPDVRIVIECSGNDQARYTALSKLQKFMEDVEAGYVTYRC